MTRGLLFCLIISAAMILQTGALVSRSVVLTRSLQRRLRPFRLLQTAGSSSRPTANELSLDSILISNQPELVASHLASRKVEQSAIDHVLQIKQLRIERINLIAAGDHAKHIRKALSKDIGMLMKEKKLKEADVLKVQVEAANVESAHADEKLLVVDKQIENILSTVPNLLDDR